MLPPRRRRLALLPLLAALIVAVPTLAQSLKSKQSLLDEPPKSVPTNELLIFLRPGTDPQAFARDYGLTPVRRLRSDPDAYVFATASVQEAQVKQRTLQIDRRPRAVYNNTVSRRERHAFTPNDPYFNQDVPETGFPGQWHLANGPIPGRDAGVQGAWDRDITGTGVTIGIVDDCLQWTHDDLMDNYVAAKSWDFGQDDGDPNPVNSDDRHGTSVAGVAAARGGNNIGVTGAAPFAGLAGLRVDFNTSTAADFVDATLYHSSGATVDIQVKNHSYGYSANYIAATAERDAATTSAVAGTIHVFSAGNDRGSVGEDSNKKMEQATPDVITVAALGYNGAYSYYSCFGANVFVTAPSNGGGYGITTTDLSGDGGYNADGTNDPTNDPFPDLNYTSQFGGTSSAAPLVAGVMALGKQAVPTMNVRLAKHALVRSSRLVDFDDTTTTGDGGWRINAAGYHFNQNYGFGNVNADGFTKWAALLGGVSAQTTAAISTTAVSAAIPDNSETGVTRTFDIAATTPLEEVLVTLSVAHTNRGDIEAYLTSPAGTRSRLMMRRASDTGDNISWTFTTNAFWGENPQGTWTLTVADVIAGTTGTWNSYAVQARMGTPTNTPAQLASVAITSPVPAKAGSTVTGRVTLDGPAPEGGAFVYLYSYDNSVTTPPFVIVSPGNASADFDITVSPSIAASGTARILAEYGVSKTATFPVYRYRVSGTVSRRGSGLGNVLMRAYKPSPGNVSDSSAPSIPIPDANTTGITSLVTLPYAGTIASLSVSVNITHPWRGDLEVTLIHPDGTEVLLHNRTGGSADNIVATYPTTAPAGDLSVLNGKETGGSWTLKVRDLEAPDAGTLNSWSLTVTVAEVNLTTTTAADGTYTIYGLPAGAFTVTPRYSKQVFSPVSRAVTLGPDATGIDFTAATYGAVDFGRSSDGTSRLLMQSVTGVRIQKWDGATMQSGPTYAPSAGWTPVSLACNDGTGGSFVLWKKGTTSFQVWSMNAAGGLSTAHPVLPAAGWTAQDISSSGDGTARLLMVSPAGDARLVILSGGTFTAGPTLPAPSGFAAVGIGTGTDNRTRLLWRKGAAAFQLWTLDATGAMEPGDPPTVATGGWTARDVSQSGDGSTRILLESPSGQVRLVSVTGATATVGPIYVPSAGWSPVALGADPTGAQARLLWQGDAGDLNLWTFHSNGALQGSSRIGTY